MITKEIDKYLNLSIEEFLKQKIYYGIHNHSDYSNIRLRDALCTVEDLINTSILKGHRGINLSDHECLSGHIEAQEYAKELHKLKNKYNEMVQKGVSKEELKNEFKNKYEIISKMPNDFMISLGNEIYLVDSLEECRDNYKAGVTKFYHFVLVAKNERGHEALRELSTHAWGNLFKTGTMERVPTTKNFLKKVMKKYKGDVIGSTACLGGELGQLVLELLQIKAKEHTDKELYDIKLKIHNFILMGIEFFGEDFVIELQPSYMAEQIAFNEMALTIAKAYKLDFIIGLDTHYAVLEDRLIHKAFLSSKDGEREVDDFYSSTYLQSTREMYEYWRTTNLGSDEDFKTAIVNTLKLKNKIETYDLCKPEMIPQRPLPNFFELEHKFKKWYEECTYIKEFAYSTYAQDRFLIHLIEKGFKKRNLPVNDEYVNRINIELRELSLISDRLKQRMSSYYNLTELIVKIMWDDNGGNSVVGISRGSATGFLINYVIGIQDMNPIKWELPHFRHLTATRPELPDIDIDTETVKREQVFNAVNNFFGNRLFNLATFKKEGTKSAIQTSARGLGIDNDISMAVSSLIPIERGKLWSLNDCVYGNEEKDRKPVKEFINEISQYPKWLETAQKIEGIINGRSIHASGVILVDNEATKQTSLMKAPNGKFITAFSMNDCQKMGLVKIDMLTTDAVSKIHIAMNLLLEAGHMEWQGSLRKTYNKYLNPAVLDYDTPEMWKMVSENSIPSLFQFDTEVGLTVAKLIKPSNLVEMAHANSLMRLMKAPSEKLSPTEKYLAFRSNIQLWYDEMGEYNLTNEEIGYLEKWLLKFYGVSSTQEDIMLLSMDKNIVGFDLTQANKLRKAVAKKSEKVMKEVKELYYKIGQENNNSTNILNYVWDKHITPQIGYSFSICHTTPYSAIALQEMNLAYHFPKIYWDCAVLISNSSAETFDLEDNEKKSGTVEYGKIAKAIGEMKKRGIVISLPSINDSNFTFAPDEKNNRIMFGIKGISGVGDEAVREIIKNRPYKSFNDFYKRVGANIGNTTNIALIKAGVFDEIENKDRISLMRKFIYDISEPIKKLTTTNITKLIENNMIPEELQLESRFYKFRKYIFNKNFYFKPDENTKSKKWYKLNNISEPFFNEHFIDELEETKDYYYESDGSIVVLDKNFDKIYKKKIENLTKYINNPTVLEKFNYIKFREVWNKYCLGTISKWEMDSLNYYYHPHELAHIDKEQYNLVDFTSLNEEPEVENTYKKGKSTIKLMKLSRVCGTIIDKNANKNTIELLTTEGVVTVKFQKGQFGHYNKQLSVVNPETGKKTVIEKSWFSRGNKVMIVGYRRDDQFVAKRYANSIYQHTVELIRDINEEGKVIASVERKNSITKN